MSKASLAENGTTKKGKTSFYYTQEALQVSDKTEDAIDASGITSKKIPNAKKNQQLKLAAQVVSWISVIFAFATGVAAIVMAQFLNSQSLFGYGLDAVLDSLSSVAVLWRFFGSVSATAAEKRERKACTVIAVLFFISAFSLIFKSAKALAKGFRDEEEGRLFTDVFSSICGVVALILGSSKVYLGRRLDSQSLLTDSIITFVGAGMSFLGVLGLELYNTDPKIWYLDSAFGLACGIFLFFFGLKLLIQMTCLYRVHDPLVDED